MDKIFFAKVRPEAKIPSKRDEDGWYDVYGCFDGGVVIAPGEIVKIPTGIASAIDSKYRIALGERGSTGVKGLAVRAGKIDSGYRDEWIVVLNNTSKYHIYIGGSRPSMLDGNVIFYPKEKAICQAGIELVPEVEVNVISYEELRAIPSERGMGKFDSTGK